MNDDIMQLEEDYSILFAGKPMRHRCIWIDEKHAKAFLCAVDSEGDLAPHGLPVRKDKWNDWVTPAGHAVKHVTVIRRVLGGA